MNMRFFAFTFIFQNNEVILTDQNFVISQELAIPEDKMTGKS